MITTYQKLNAVMTNYRQSYSVILNILKDYKLSINEWIIISFVANGINTITDIAKKMGVSVYIQNC